MIEQEEKKWQDTKKRITEFLKKCSRCRSADHKDPCKWNGHPCLGRRCKGRMWIDQEMYGARMGQFYTKCRECKKNIG